MKATLIPGLRHEAGLTVTDALTVPQVAAALEAFHDMPPVFATAFMVAFIEATCIECMAPHLEPGEHSVGIHVDVSHTAATPPGMAVTAAVEVIAVEKRILTFRVEAADAAGPIGQGLHKRAVIDQARFLEGVAQKAG